MRRYPVWVGKSSYVSHIRTSELLQKTKLISKLRHLLLTGLLLVLCSSGKVAQEGSAADEYTLKALFVYNFTKHIDWPTSASMGNRFLICVTGKSEIKEKLQATLKGRKILDKPIEIKEITRPEEAEGAQILYICRGRIETAQSYIDHLFDKPLLIITEDRNMIQKGSCINLIQKDGKLRFELSETNLRNKGLRVSNQLSGLAVVIK